MASEKDINDRLPPTVNEDFFKISFDPIEAIFLATILQDCYYQLFNVGKAFEPKSLRLPALIEAEKKGRTDEKLLSEKGRDASQRNVRAPSFSECHQGGGDDGYTSLDEGSHWVEKLVEASGFLESMYMDILERAQEVIEGQKNSQDGPVMQLEDEGIRMKTFELSKIIADRQNLLNQAASDRVDCILDGLKSTISITSQELRAHGTFEHLKKRNREELREFEKASEMVEEEIFYFNKCKQLLESILQEKFQGWGLMREREIQVASLKDYLKEQKVLKALEINYVKKFSEAKLDQAKKMNDKTIEEIKEKEACVKMEVENDKMCNQVMESYLKKEIGSLENELKEWTAKYESMLESRTQELRRLQEKQAKDQEWHTTLKKRIVEYEQVIVDEERMQRLQDEAEKLLKLQHKNATKIQAWWKGMTVRKCLGAFKKKKAKKGKKG